MDTVCFEKFIHFSYLDLTSSIIYTHVIILQGIATTFILCELRTKAFYRAMWKKIIELTPALQKHVKFIMTDYEKAAIAVLHKCFPTASIHECWFHYNQVKHTFHFNCYLIFFNFY